MLSIDFYLNFLTAPFSSPLSAAEKQLCPNFRCGIIVLNCLCAATDFAPGSLPSVGHVDHVGRGLHVTGSQTGGTGSEDVEGTGRIDDAAALQIISTLPSGHLTSWTRVSVFKAHCGAAVCFLKVAAKSW